MSAFVKPLHAIIMTIIADDDRQLYLANIKIMNIFTKKPLVEYSLYTPVHSIVGWLQLDLSTRFVKYCYCYNLLFNI